MRKTVTTSAVIAAAGLAGIVAAGTATAADVNPAMIGAGNTQSVITDGGSAVAFVHTSSSGAESVRRVNASNLSDAVVNHAVGAGLHAEIDMSGNGTAIAVTTVKADGTANALQFIRSGNGYTGTLAQQFSKISRPSIDASGHFIAFAGTPVGSTKSNAYRWDTAYDTATQITSGSGVSNVVISGNGLKIGYSVGGHAYARTVGGGITPIDVHPDGAKFGGSAKPIALSANGNYALFASTDASGDAACADGPDSGDVIHGCVYRRDLGGSSVLPALYFGRQRPVTVDAGSNRPADLSGDGRIAAFDDDTTGYAEAYRFATKTTSGKLDWRPGDAHKAVAVSLDNAGDYLAYGTQRNSDGEHHNFVTETGF